MLTTRPGILGATFGADSGVDRWAADNRNFLRGMGSALLSNGMNFSDLPRFAALDGERRRQAAEWDRDGCFRRRWDYGSGSPRVR